MIHLAMRFGITLRTMIPTFHYLSVKLKSKEMIELSTRYYFPLVISSNIYIYIYLYLH